MEETGEVEGMKEIVIKQAGSKGREVEEVARVHRRDALENQRGSE